LVVGPEIVGGGVIPEEAVVEFEGLVGGDVAVEGEGVVCADPWEIVGGWWVGGC